MAGKSLLDQGVTKEVVPPYFSVKEAVFPFIKFPGADTILGPEMKSTGEVMGVGETFGEAFVKSQLAAGYKLPKRAGTFISVRDGVKPPAVESRAGWRISASLWLPHAAPRRRLAAAGTPGSSRSTRSPKVARILSI